MAAPASNVRARIISTVKSGRVSVRASRPTAISGNAAKTNEVNPLRALAKAAAVIPKGAKNPAGTKFLG